MAKQSLVSKREAPNVPAVLNPGEGAVQSTGAMLQQTPYVWFASAKSENFGKMAGRLRDLNDGDPVLVLPEPRLPVRLNPFRFHLLYARQYWVERDQQFEVIRATRDRDTAKGDSKLREEVQSVILVYTDAGIVAATCNWVTTKTPAVHRATEALTLAGTPEWGNQSAEHQLTLQAPYAWLRFAATVKTAKRTSKTSGFSYTQAAAVIHPTTAADWTAVSSFFQGDEGRASAEAVKEAYDRRCAQLDQLCK